MIKNQKRKGPELQILICMIAAGIIHLAIVFAAVVLAAARRCKWLSEIGRL